MQNDSTVPQINVQNWSKADLGGIGQKLAEIDWVSQFASKGRAGKWEAFKRGMARVQGQLVLVRVDDKAGKLRKHWLKRNVEPLVRKKEAYFRYRHSGSSKSLCYIHLLYTVPD